MDDDDDDDDVILISGHGSGTAGMKTMLCVCCLALLFTK